MTRRSASIAVLVAIALLSAVPRAHAVGLFDPSSAGFAPRVPLSAFARPATWFDPSRLHLVSTVSLGSGFGGSSSTSALQVTSLSYQFGAPFSMSVSLGNTFGLDRARNGGSPFFLEGFDLAWRPSGNAIFRVAMHDYRSPLQYGAWGRGYPGADPFTTPY
jgi:hypothetical protein